MKIIRLRRARPSIGSCIRSDAQLSCFGGDKPTWILNYSWDGAKNVQPRDAMLNLAMSELMVAQIGGMLGTCDVRLERPADAIGI